jgi:D-beta-D-heptose 7-phosphate kinase/D-beta-D-heptose 1-phosphate adenosyltransferase
MPQQKQFNVLLIGDSCVDEYVYGSCERLNPEAPVPVLNYKRTEVRKGMCLNVLENLKAFGLTVEVVTQEEKIIKTRYIDEKSNQQILRVDNESKIIPYSLSIFSEKYDAIVISDYDKGFLSRDKIFDIVETSKCPVFIDSKKSYLPTKNCFVKINDIEYQKIENPSDNIIITKGGKGAEYKGILYPGEKVSVYDVVGAGDTFLSALVAFYLKYGILEKAIPYANKAASIAVQNQGTYVLNQGDINEICN